MSNCYCLPGKAGGLPILFKKVCACRGATALGRLDAAPGLVCRATRPRSEETRFHRRDRGVHQSGAQRRTMPKGSTAARRIPHGHHKTITLVAGLRLSGMVAQKAFDQPMNAATFMQWVEKCLAPTLSKGDASSWAIYRATRARRSNNSSKRPEPSCDTCRPTVLT